MDRRPVDLESDRELVLELHCRGNYESDSPWARRGGYEGYRRDWLDSPQPAEFLASLERSLGDSNTIAEIWEDDGERVGFLWVTFGEFAGLGITFAEVNDLEVVESHWRRGIGTAMLECAEEAARAAGADLLRSETGIENTRSQGLHAKSGFEQYHILYEKVLSAKLVRDDR